MQLLGCGAFFIDVEGEYTNLTKMLGGKVIKIEQGKSAGVNPFEIEPDTKGNMQFINILDKVAEIRALLGTICRNYGRTLTGTENTEIEIVVNQLYAEKGITSDVNSLFEKKGGRLDNGKYELFTDYPIAQADESVYRFIEKQEQKEEKRDLQISEIYQGQRNDTLFRLGCSLQRSGLSDEAIESCLKLENKNRCIPPLEDKEVETIIKSVFKYKKDFVSYSKYEGSYTSASLLNSEEDDEPDIVEDMIPIGLTLTNIYILRNPSNRRIHRF